MPFVTDTFTDTSGTNLSSHTGETGATWTIRTDGGGNGSFVITDANRIRCASLGGFSSAALYHASGTPGAADYSVSADFVCVTNSGNIGILIRYDTATGNGYWLQYRTFFGWRLHRISGGATVAQVGSTFSTELSAGQSVTATVTVSGSSFTVALSGAINNATAITGTDSTYSAAGKAGVLANGSNANNTVGVHLDNFDASDSGGGGGGDTRAKLIGGDLFSAPIIGGSLVL